MRQFYPISHCKVNRWFNLVLQVIFFSFSETSWICYWIFNELKYIAYHLCLRFFIFQMTKWMAFLLFFQLKNLSAEIAHWRTKQTKIVKFPHWNGYKAFSLLCTHPVFLHTSKGSSQDSQLWKHFWNYQARSSRRFFLALMFKWYKNRKPKAAAHEGSLIFNRREKMCPYICTWWILINKGDKLETSLNLTVSMWGSNH